MSPPYRRATTLCGRPTKFPGRRALLRALKDDGTWTTQQMFAWARNHGGTRPAFAALAALEEQGKVTHTPKTAAVPEHWTYVHRDIRKDTQSTNRSTVSENTPITLVAMESKNLDTTCYRGSAPLRDLAWISQADVFDQEQNPEGLQRDLNKRHAAAAYDYVAGEKDKRLPRAYPEVILNVRDRKVMQREVIAEGDGFRLVALTFDTDKILNARSTKVSRVDGNHRLVYAGGDGKDRLPIDLSAPFQVHVGLSRDEEVNLFATINHEQKGLNTSHLAILNLRITPADVELTTNPARVFARQLAHDTESPWHDKVHMGGSRVGTKAAGKYMPITFIALEHGIQRTLKKSQYLPEQEPDAQYSLIRSYWQAVKAVWPEAFDNPRDFLVTKNIGVQTLSAVAATVIDRCMMAGKVEVGHMVPFLEAAKGEVDWHKNSPDVAGMSGNRAVNLLAGKMTKGLPKPA